MRHKEVDFPLDEGRHHHALEWWYWNGHLWTESSRHFAFMNCLFRLSPKKMGFPLNDLYSAHYLLIDVDNGTKHAKIDYLVRLSDDSFQRDGLLINYTDPLFVSHYLGKTMEEERLGHYHLKDGQVDLYLRSNKPAMLNGGQGYVGLAGESSYYYSLTDLTASGYLTAKERDKPLKVTGRAWMDHQWANTIFRHDSWTWFSLQLSGQIEVLLYEYHNDKRQVFLAQVSEADGQVKLTRKLELRPRERFWRSRKTGKDYFLDWQIRVPDLDLLLNIKAETEDAEMIFGPMSYWEGPISATGHYKQKAVNGLGFQELVGRPALHHPDHLQKLFKEAKKIK